MQEHDYITATNLVKIRLARNLIQDMVPVNDDQLNAQAAACRALFDWMDWLESEMIAGVQ